MNAYAIFGAARREEEAEQRAAEGRNDRHADRGAPELRGPLVGDLIHVDVRGLDDALASVVLLITEEGGLGSAHGGGGGGVIACDALRAHLRLRGGVQPNGSGGAFRCT